MTPVTVSANRLSFSARRRSGLSLLEVILALAILAAALMTLSNLLDIGIESAGNARDLTRAQILCETKLAELTSGIEPLETVRMAQFEYDPEWFFSVWIESTEEEGLVKVNVAVQRAGTVRGRSTFSLTRWVIDPGLDLSEEEEEEEEEEDATEEEAIDESVEGFGGANG